MPRAKPGKQILYAVSLTPEAKYIRQAQRHHHRGPALDGEGGDALLPRKGGLASETLNHLRAAAHRVYAHLKRGGIWTQDNPASKVQR